ncbi:fimbrial protein [Serratia sp. NA_112.1]|uniref:fimbrial protein n=1 Tax=unclassified Serratia (in: enterobacteria) TaxID=2647522 RepID=UPI004046EC94
MKGRATMQQRTCLALATLCAVMPLLAGAAATSTVTIKVKVVQKPCTINAGKPIEVDFGEVMTTQVDGNNYRTRVNYTLKCNSSPWVKLQVKGTGAAFDTKLLQTTKAGLGIQMQLGSNLLPVNSWRNFYGGFKEPDLWVVPVKQSGVTLSGGEFTAGATMLVDYQ